MIDFKKGCIVPHPERIFEEYEQTEHGYIANVSTKKIINVLKDFISIQEELVFFFLEVPTKLDEENERENEIVVNLHKDIYYMDNLTKEEAFCLLENEGELLVNDGLCQFGFGSQANNDEIMVEKYNIVTICCNKANAYDNLFAKNGIKETKDLVTAWDTFSKDAPGYSEKIEIDGKTVYSLIKEYEEFGLYFAERRES